MPDTAIAAGVIDLVLPVEQIGPRLAGFAHSFRMMEQFAEADRGGEDQTFDEIYRILLNRVGHDFSGYKKKTFAPARAAPDAGPADRQARRLSRILKESPEEVTLLFRGLLIGVTNFFRDPDAFRPWPSR